MGFNENILKIFNDPNYMKAIGLFFVLSFSFGFLSYLLIGLLPTELRQIITPITVSLITNLLIGIFFSIMLQIIFKQSITFRIALCFSLGSTAIGLSSSVTRLFGETLETTLVTYAIVGTFCISLVIYTIKSVQNPLFLMQDQL